jgi:probable phosphoglycerate mutase
MTGSVELYILRHGQTEWNVEGRMQGALNSALTDLGRAQAARQGEILQSLDLANFDILTSPQGRARETASIALAPQVSLVKTDPRLREIGVGEWAGKLRARLGTYDGPYGDLSHYDHAPGGEGFEALEARCRGFLESLSRPAVLVTHGMTSRMIRAISTGSGRAEVHRIGGGQGIVYHVKDGAQKRLE